MFGKVSAAVGAVLAAFAVFLATRGSGDDKRTDESVYELRIYTTHPGKLPDLNKRFRDHTTKLFEKHGMKNVIYLVPADKENTLVYLLKHESMDAAKKSWDGFRNDPDWKKAREASEAAGPIVAKVESQYLKATDYSPQK
jgi:hypothetical protein